MVLVVALLAALEVAPIVSARELRAGVANGGRQMLLIEGIRGRLFGDDTPKTPTPKAPAVEQPNEEDLVPLLEAEAPEPKTAFRQNVDRAFDGIIKVIGPFGDFIGEIANIAGAVIPSVL